VDNRPKFDFFTCSRYRFDAAWLTCGLARTVLEMENFHEVWRSVHAVIDHNRRMHQLAYTRASLNPASDIREASEKLNVVQDSVAEALGGGGKISPRVSDDSLKVG